MDLGQVKIAVGINVDIIKGIVTHLYVTEVIPPTFEFGNILIHIDEPSIEVRDPATDARLGLHITGSFENGDDEATPFDIWMKLKPFVKTVSGSAPVASLSVEEVEEATPEDIGGLVGTFAIGMINDILQNMDIPIYNSLIGGIESAAFDEDAIPERSTWSTDFYLGAISEIEHVQVGFPPGQPQNPQVNSSTMRTTTPALIATLSLPGESAQIIDNPSIVPNHTGIQVIISRDAMNLVLQKNAESKIGEEIEGAKINAMQMSMHDLGIQISGEAEKSDATIEWDGILLLFFRKFYNVKGSIRWHDGFVDVFTSGIDVDVDIPWYVKLLRAFLFILGPIGWILDATLIAPKISEAEEAPDLVRGAFRKEVGEALQEMIGNVGGLSGEDAIPFMDFGQDSWVMNGHYTHSILAFAGYNREQIATVEHDTFEIPGAHGASVGMLTLESGYRLHPQELGRLLKSTIMNIPNAHGVEADFGFYVRTNPNDETSDNLVDPAEIHIE
ncbi:hypothetical protein [Aquimarina pacifica]|uniref:hypothetical protein n=1 Tax=Aquimarina pacifica TaxID=1296415 RepID=UPI00047003D4|nr:hypothetical protein [Aquimarina pacifica]